jgi:hypothetical protein
MPDPAEQACLQAAPDGEEVPVPAPALEHAEQPVPRLGEGDQVVGLGGGERERLVHDHVPAGPQRRRGQLVVDGVGRGHHHQLDLRVLQQLGGRGHRPDPGKVPLDLAGPAGHDRVQAQPRLGLDQGGVEHRPAQPVADQPDPDGFRSHGGMMALVAAGRVHEAVRSSSVAS